jgi:hypothetical protein
MNRVLRDACEFLISALGAQHAAPQLAGVSI